MDDIAITFAVVAAVVVLFVWNKVPVELVAIGAILMLWATGVLRLDQIMAGFGDPTVIFIASLFVVSEALDATGVTSWMGQRLIAWAGDGRTRLLVLMMAIVALLTALISVNGAVAALLPVVVVMAVRLGRSPSQLMMPLVFFAHAGSLLALTGTPVHVLVMEASLDAGGGGFGFFSFALVGVPVLLAVTAIIVLFGERLLPDRTPETLPSDLSTHARTLVEEYALRDGLFRLRIRAGSSLIGRREDDVDLASYGGLAIVGVESFTARQERGAKVLETGDILVVRGASDTVASLANDHDLALRSDDTSDDLAKALVDRRSGLAEVVIPPRSSLIGAEMFVGGMSASGDLMLLAVQRGETELAPGTVRLQVGDTLLLQGTWDALDTRLARPDVLLVDTPEAIRRQAVPMGARSREALMVLAGMVVLLATGVVPPVIAGLLAASAMILMRVVSMQGAYRGINWTTVVLVGAMIPLSTAMVQSGAADRVANLLVEVVGGLGPYALLAGLFVVTAVFGQLISNMATALIMIPIGIAAATSLGVSVQPVLMSLTVAAAAAFLTPVATPVNLMVMAPGGYRFGDYWKLGLPLLLVFFMAAVFLVPVFWPF
ncbi:MAG: SLC13 family permease [Chloroflexi bacterium]|nr:SLC13 family permease [Chloroflexota bacterium]